MLQLTQELFGAEDPDMGRVAEDESQMSVLLDFAVYFSELASYRRELPTSDLASVIANACINGQPLSDVELMGHYVIIATAGHDTTANSIAGGLLALIEQPEQLERLRSDPELIHQAADELIRWVSPVKHFVRTCREPFTIRDVTFQPDDLVLLSYASANRDDEVFTHPFTLDVSRENAASHLAFGFGRHFCLGAHPRPHGGASHLQGAARSPGPHRARRDADMGAITLRARPEVRPGSISAALTCGTTRQRRSYPVSRRGQTSCDCPVRHPGTACGCRTSVRGADRALARRSSCAASGQCRRRSP